MNKPIKVLVIDDSALVRELLTRALDGDPGIKVVDSAADPYVARDMIRRYRPDVLTLDVEMPRMDGVEFLRRLMPQWPLPVVMVSALTERGKQITLEALEAGAVDVVTKPKADVSRGLESMVMELRTKVKIAATANVSHWKHKRHDRTTVRPVRRERLVESTDKVIAIGASTGGTEAIRTMLEVLPVTTPGVVIVQHMPAGFTRLFSERLNGLCAVEVKEAEQGDRIMQGRVLVAPGGLHLRVLRRGGWYQVDLREGQTVCGHCPSVEVMMQSVARYVGRNAVGVMLTGMGRDGADGMRAMRDAGARCLAQDEATSVVFGMPKEAYATGGAERLVPLEGMAAAVLDLLSCEAA